MAQKLRCSVVGCSVDAQRPPRHMMPRDPELRMEWARRIGRPTTDTRRFLYVCARHFSPDAYHMSPLVMQSLGMRGKIKLRDNAVPTLHLPKSKQGPGGRCMAPPSPQRNSGAVVTRPSTECGGGGAAQQQRTTSQILQSCATPTQATHSQLTSTAVSTDSMPADTSHVCLRKPQDERPRPVKVTIRSLLEGTQTLQQSFEKKAARRTPWISVRPTLEWKKLRPFLCAVVGCVQSTQGRTLHPLPQNPELRKIWIQRIGNPKVDPERVLYVCGRHFTGDSYKLSPQLTRALGFACRTHLRPDALPTLCLPAGTTPQATPTQSSRSLANLTAALPTGTPLSESSGDISADVTHQGEEERPVTCTVGVQTSVAQRTACTAQRTACTQTLPDSQRNVRTQANVVVKTQMSQTCGSDLGCSDRDGVPPHHYCAALGTGRQRCLRSAFQRATPIDRDSSATTSREDWSLNNRTHLFRSVWNRGGPCKRRSV